MILEAVPVRPSEPPNGHQIINRTSRHFAEALPFPPGDLGLTGSQYGVTAAEYRMVEIYRVGSLCRHDPQAEALRDRPLYYPAFKGAGQYRTGRPEACDTLNGTRAVGVVTAAMGSGWVVPVRVLVARTLSPG